MAWKQGKAAGIHGYGWLPILLVLCGAVLAGPELVATVRADAGGAPPAGEGSGARGAAASANDGATQFRAGVCPPFPLRNEAGEIINPISGDNADQPYSPRQTCGACHDYDKITRGYHFTQGKGEAPTPAQAARCAWVTSPGNYGGTW